MSTLTDNIKRIRLVAKKTQDELGTLLGVNEDKQKSYELNRARPNILYMEQLIQFSGFSQRELLNNKLTTAAIKERMNKVNKGMVSRETGEGSDGETSLDAPNLADLPAATSIHPIVDALKNELITTLKDQIQGLKDQVKAQREQHGLIERILETSLVAVSNEVKVVQGQIKGAAAYAALKVAGGDPVRAESEMDEIDKMIADRVQVGVQTGTGVGR